MVARNALVVARNALVVARNALVVARNALVVARNTLMVARNTLVVARNALVVACNALVVACNALVVARNALVVARDALVIARNAQVVARDALALRAFAGACADRVSIGKRIAEGSGRPGGKRARLATNPTTLIRRAIVMSSGNDIFPRRNPEKIGWLKNYSAKLPTYNKILGFPDARVTASQAQCDELATALTDIDNKYAAYQAQVAATRSLQKSHLAGLRADANFIKASPGYTDAIGLDLGVAHAATQGVAPATLKAIATATVRKGLVRISWKKASFDSANIYMRHQGESDWRLLGRSTHSPYDDTTALSKPGVVEIREYQVVGMRKDQDIGQPSDIITATFAG